MDCIEKTAYYLRGECKDKDILEVGSMDGAKRLRTLLSLQKPKSYIGVDIHKGINVDVKCYAENVGKVFKDKSFDVIVSTTVLEHVKDWKAAIHGMKKVCKDRGYIVLSAPSVFPYHKDPEDYWRFSLKDIRHIFSDFYIENIEEDNIDRAAYAYIKGAKGRMVIIKAQKRRDFKEIDLTDYEVKKAI